MPVFSVCLKLNFISLSILCFSIFLCFILFLLLFEIIFITFRCNFDKFISLVQNIGSPCTLGNILLIGVSSLKKTQKTISYVNKLKYLPRAIFMQICAAITEKCILSYSSVNITDNLLIF